MSLFSSSELAAYASMCGHRKPREGTHRATLDLADSGPVSCSLIANRSLVNRRGSSRCQTAPRWEWRKWRDSNPDMEFRKSSQNFSKPLQTKGILRVAQFSCYALLRREAKVFCPPIVPKTANLGEDGEGRNRTEAGSFSKIHYSAITTPPTEANSLITNERQ